MTIDPAEMTLDGFQDRWDAVGDLTAGIDEAAGIAGVTAGRWWLPTRSSASATPHGRPHYRKQPGEPPRVQPSKRKMDG